MLKRTTAPNVFLHPERGGASRRSAVVAVQVLTIMMVLLGMAALAVDLGFIFNATAEMQRAVDAGALAGASSLDEGSSTAADRARTQTGLNVVAGHLVLQGPDTNVDVEVGLWNGLEQSFTPATGQEGVLPNAVRVASVRDPLPLYFARALGQNTARVAKQAVALFGAGRCAGIWGIDGITGDGNISTDSYIAADGPYGGANVRANGDICSGADIELHGTVDIYGDAMYGGDSELIVEGSPTIYGITGGLCCPLDPPVVDDTDARITNDNDTIGTTDRGRDPFEAGDWDLVVTGNDNLTLNGGTYYFTSVLIDGRSTLTVTAPTTIYVSGDAYFTGNGLINVSQNPSDLVIYSTGLTVAVSGTAGFYGVVVAPDANIQLVGTGEYFGALVGLTLDIDGTADVHVEVTAVRNLLGLDASAPVLVQ